jgi:hypothetical protein
LPDDDAVTADQAHLPDVLDHVMQSDEALPLGGQLLGHRKASPQIVGHRAQEPDLLAEVQGRFDRLGRRSVGGRGGRLEGQ